MAAFDPSTARPVSYDTALSPDDEKAFQSWKSEYAPQDSGDDYDLRGAFKAGLKPDSKTGHWPDTFKKPNHPTFSNESQYAVGADAAKAGHWEGDKYIPAGGGFDPSTAQPVEFDPSTAEEVTASWGDTLKAIPSQVVGGAEQSAGGMTQFAGEQIKPPMEGMNPMLRYFVDQTPVGQFLESAHETGGNISETGKTLYDIGQARLQSDTPKNQTFWQRAVSTAAQSGGQAVPLTLGAIITGSPELVAAGFGAEQFGQSYGEARAQGLPEDKAFRYAAINGLAEAGTEFLPVKVLFKKDPGFVKRFVNFMAAELPGENISNLTQLANAWANGLRDDVTWQDVKDTIETTSAATLLTGGVQTGAAHLAHKAAAGPTPEDIANAPDEELDGMVDKFLEEPDQTPAPPVPDIEAFDAEVAASEKQGADRRAVPRGTEERRDPKRPILEKLTPEEQDIMLRSDVIPSLPGKRAFELHMEKNPDQRVMFIDFDEFKAINDKRGEKETDRAILAPSGEIMEEVRKDFPDVRVFHRSGDEFLATGAKDERLQEFKAALRKRLKNSKFEAILPDGTTDTLDGIEFSDGIGHDEETARAAAKREKIARREAGLRKGTRDTDVAGPAPAGNQVPAGQVAFDPSTAKPIDEPAGPYISPKLKRLHYRGQLKKMADTLQRNSGGELVGGDFSPLNEDVARGKETAVRRLPSVNPEWFKAMAANTETNMTVAEVQKAVEKALAGEKLGARQARVVETMLAEIEGKRTEPDQLETVKKARGEARQLRELAAKGAPPNVLERIPAEFYDNAGELFEESEYPPEWSGSARSLFELATMAQEAGFGEEVETILGKDLPDADAARQLFELMEGQFNDATEQQASAAETAEQQKAGAPAEAPQAAAESQPVLKPAQTGTQPSVDPVIKKLQAKAMEMAVATAEKFGVNKSVIQGVYLVGSRARGAARKKSDIDILVKTKPEDINDSAVVDFEEALQSELDKLQELVEVDGEQVKVDYFVSPEFDNANILLQDQETPAPAAQAQVAQPQASQQRQTDTPEFRRWFGDSKVVDADGKPLVVYHGTPAGGFTEFSESTKGMRTGHSSDDVGFHFTDSADYADAYSEGYKLEGIEKYREMFGQEPSGIKMPPGATIYPAFLKIENPLTLKESKQINRAMIDKAKADGYDGIIADMGGVKEYVAFRPEQIKSAIGNRGTFDEADPNILHANPVAAVYAAYQRLGQKVLTRVHDAIGWKMTPLGKLPAQDLYLKERYETLGKIADVEAISKRIWETFGPLDANEAALVYEYFTTRGADESKLSNKPVRYTWKGQKVDSTVRQQAVAIKKLIDRIGQQLVDRGLLHKDSYEKYEDAYLPRVYLKHIMGDGRQFGAGKKPSDMGYLKERKDIPKEIREIILGEITDPGYLASKSLGKSMRDIAILDWFEEIAQRPDWALQDFLVDYKGKKVSIFWLKAESDRIKQQIPYYTPANQTKAKQITQQMDAIVARGQKQLGKVTDDYRQVPDNAQHGRLRGMFIRKEIYNDITGIPGSRDPNAEWWQQPFEYGGIGTKATQLWKMAKVALNPPTQVRNFVSNGILLQLSGVGTHRVLPLMIQAIQEIRQNGKAFRIAKKYGITASTFANNELYKIERQLLDLKAKNAGKLSMAQLKAAGAAVADFAGDAYQISEAIWKTAKIIDAMKREGKGEVEAVLDAQKWLYDYSLVPQTVRYMRNTPIGVPFLTFYYKTLPRMLEVMATAPHRFAPYVAIPALFTAWIASAYDVEPEDVEKLKKALPQWLQDHGHLFFLPYKDQHGRWQAFDFSYLLPWSMFEQTTNNLKQGQVGEALQTSGVIGGPVPDLISALRTNIDPFTKKPIVDKSDPPAEQVKSIMNYLWSMAAPPWLTDNGAIKKMWDAVMDNPNPKTGDPQLTLPQAALRLGGMNLYPIEPEETRQRNLRNMEFEIKEIEKRMGERLRDVTLTAEDKKNIREVYRELAREKQQQMKDYREASKIHPNLKGEPVKKKADGEQDA